MKNNGGLYFLDKLRDVVETVLFTSCIKNENPVSVIIVGPSGSAKSKLLRKYRNCAHLHMTDSITSAGLWDIVQKDNKGEKKFLILPDINPTLSRRASTTSATVGNLLSITGDGTIRVDDGRGDKIVTHPVMGLITACTPEMYQAQQRRWYALGLIRRVVPVFYDYTDETIDKLQKLIGNGQIHASFGEAFNFRLPESHTRPSINRTIEFELKANQFALNLGKLSFLEKGIKKWQIKKVLPLSPHVVLRTLAMAYALRRKSGRVGEKELTFVREFVSFTDPERPRML